MGMQEARHEFLKRFEQQSTPAARARQRKEQEAKKREQDKRKHEEEKKQHEAEWYKREMKRKAQDRELNKEQRRQWQAWDDQQQSASSSLPLERRNTTEEVTSSASAGHAQHSMHSAHVPTPSAQHCIICGGSGLLLSNISICESCADESHSLTAANSVSNSMTTPQAALNCTSPWPCPVCTYVNNGNALRCDMCQTAQPAPMPVQVTADSSFTGTTPNGDRLVGSAAQFGGVTAGHENMPCESLLAWLQQNRLEEYHSCLLKEGYDDLEVLRGMEPHEFDECCQSIQMKPGHRVKFRNALGQNTKHRSNGANQRECPVCLIGTASNVDVALTPCGYVFCAEHAAEASCMEQCPVCGSTPASTQRVFV